MCILLPSFHSICPWNVFEAICDFRSNSSAGPDGLDVKLLYMVTCADVSTDLFNLSRKTSSFPWAWKTSGVSLSLKEEIQLIEITSAQYQWFVLEPKCLTQWSWSTSISWLVHGTFDLLFSLLLDLLSQPSQPWWHLFRIYSPPLIIITLWDQFLDLSKAFDLVHHYELLDELHAIGLHTDAVWWFCSSSQETGCYF